MALFINKNDDLIICTSNKLIIFQSNDGSTTEVCIPELIMPPNLTKNQEECLKNEKVSIITCAFSECGSLCAVTTTNKQLVVYNKDFKVMNNINVNRTASKVRFTTCGDILVADKTGDVYLYKLNENHEVVQVLGHLSMVLDVLTAQSDKYIITSDRDEKIRVSNFPSGYNIVSFCLGHEEFVLSLELFNSNTLISASGDGTIRFWNYLSGKELAIINTNEYVDDKSLLKKFAEQMDRETVEVTSLPITCMKVKLIDNYAIIICSLHCYNDLLVFHVTDDVVFKLLQIIKVDGDIISFDLHNVLYVLTSKNIQCYNFDSNLFVANDYEQINKLYMKFKGLIKSFSITENISVLYKRKFDNVQEYQERKKLRIENKK